MQRAVVNFVNWVDPVTRRLLAAVLLSISLAAALGPLGSIHFVEVARSAGLIHSNTFGGIEKKDYLLESTGTGVAIFDFDGDGANDIFIANGTTLDRARPGSPRF